MGVDLDTDAALAELRSAMGSLPDGTVFGQPVERDGVTMVPAARVRFGGGEGKGQRPDTGQDGWGHGYAGTGAPVGAFVLAGGKVEWVPAVDVQRLNLGWQVVAGLGILVAGAAMRRLLR